MFIVHHNDPHIMLSQKMDHEFWTIYLFKQTGNNGGYFYYKIK